MPTMRSNTCGGGPSIDSKVTVGPLEAIAKALALLAAPLPAQPTSAHATTSSNAVATACPAWRNFVDASLIEGSDIVKKVLRLGWERHTGAGPGCLRCGAEVAIDHRSTRGGQYEVGFSCNDRNMSLLAGRRGRSGRCNCRVRVDRKLVCRLWQNADADV